MVLFLSLGNYLRMNYALTIIYYQRDVSYVVLLMRTA